MSAVMSEQQSSNNVAEFFSPGPGERLRAARLSMGFDLAKIASELHLTKPVVEALEADHYDDIGARVFVRGYLRNYARIVDMPVESILRQFDEKWPDDSSRQSMVRESPTLPADGGPSRGMAGAMTWLLVLALIALFLVWWRGYLDEIVPEQMRSGNVAEDQAQPMDDTLMAGDAEIVSPDGSLLLPGSGMEGLADAADGADPVGIEGLDGRLMLPTAPPEPDAARAQTDAQAEAAMTAPAAVSGGSPVASVEPVQTPAATAAATESADGGAPVVEGTKQIVMTFSAPCWVDVRDSERKFKLFGEMEKGSRKVLGGQPPYKLIVGNAEAVTITVNGRPFDLTPFAKGNVARFTLDP